MKGSQLCINCVKTFKPRAMLKKNSCCFHWKEMKNNNLGIELYDKKIRISWTISDQREEVYSEPRRTS